MQRAVDMLSVSLSVLEAKCGKNNVEDFIDTISSAHLCKDEFKRRIKNREEEPCGVPIRREDNLEFLP